MYKILIPSFLLLSLMSCQEKSTKKIENPKPNIVIVYVDDLGYGDTGTYGAVGVETPNIDKLATNGMQFTDAHCSAATCTPSRYSLLTGSHAFRNDAAVLQGDAPLIIDTKMETLPKMLQKSGYKTGVVGKWHLGVGNGNVDWNGKVSPGPLEIGFDYSFLLPSTGDRVPSVYLENHHVVNLDPADPITVSYEGKVGNLPDGVNNPELLKQGADLQHSNTIINGISRIGFMTGGEKAWWTDEDFPEVLTSKAKSFIQKNKENPFFLYMSYHDIHVPRVPNAQFAGKTPMGLRGDAIAQMDWCTGEVVNYLEELGLDKNTLIVFTSDNGPVLSDGYDDKAIEKLGDHKPAGPYRGGKYSAYEAGTRVPTITYWPGKITTGKSDALWSQLDLYASLATLVGHELDSVEAPDSFDYLDVILGKSDKGREILLEESYTFSLRKGNWKYIQPTKEKEKANWIKNDKNIEAGISEKQQLFNLANDEGEQHNVVEENMALAKEMDSIINVLKVKTARIH